MMEPSMMAFAVTGDSVTPRRAVVSDVLCENCHSNLSLHGDNRKNADYCTTCHQPDLTDAAVRPEGEFPDQSVHFKYMIHKIHRGEELVNPYVVYGYRSSLHDYSEVEYPGDLRNCSACHVDGSEQLPLPEGLLATTTPQDWWNPTMPNAAACLSCHDDDDAAAHAASNTTFFGESCSVCHGEGKSAAVDKVHAQ
jgi:OmcA/MtrC family decaheme c-type cytochrome